MKLLIILVALASIGAGPTATQPSDSRASDAGEVQELRETVKRLAEQNADLQQEVSRLGKLLKDAGVDPTAQPLQKPAGGPVKTSGNLAAAKAVQLYSDTVEQIRAGNLTAIQKRIKWLDANKKLRDVLRKSQVSIDYEVRDVTVTTDPDVVTVYVSAPTILSGDNSVPDVGFEQFYEYRIRATAAEAAKIAKGSKMNVTGTLDTNVDFTQPASLQPAIIELRLFSDFQPIGDLQGVPSLFGNDLLNESPKQCLMMPISSKVEIDGASRRLK